MTNTAAIQKILDWKAEHLAELEYSQGSTRLSSNLKLPTDCSGLEARMFEWAAQLNIGTWTGNEVTHGVLVTVSKSAARIGYGMHPGDLIFYTFPYEGGSPNHVNMYAGGDLVYNHGGPGKGPVKQSLMHNVDAATKVQVRRMIPLITGTVTHPPVVSKTPENPMHDKPIPAIIARGTEFFGLISGGNDSHGGAYESEQPSIKLIQEFLNFKLKAGLKVDGTFGTTTFKAVASYQHQYLPHTTNYGEVWFDDWHSMAAW